MKRQRTIKTAVLTLAIATAGLVGQVGFAQSGRAVKLELFAQVPTSSATALSTANIESTGSLADLKAAEFARQARYLRVTVNQNGQQDVRIYRVLINPNNGRTFVFGADRQTATALDNLLRKGGLEVSKDNLAVTMGSGEVALQVDGIQAGAPAATDTAAAPASSTATDTSTSGASASSTPADASTTTTPAAGSDTSASSTTTTPAAGSDASATSTTTAPADASTPAASSTMTATDTSSAGAPAASSDATSGGTQPLTAEVKQDLGKLNLTVLPTAATAPATSNSNFYILPFTDAASPTQTIDDNVVTLDYDSKASMADVIGYYEKLMADQGFTKVEDDVANTKTDNDFVQVYKRGEAVVTLSVSRDANGKYQVIVDLADLVQSLGQ